MTRVAALVTGLDGLFLPPSVTSFALARAGMPEARWAAEAWPDRALPYRPRGSWDTTETLLIDSDIAAVMARRGVSNLLLTTSVTPMIRAWANAHDIRLWMSPYNQQLELEDKIHFHRWCASQGLPTPPGQACTLSSALPVPLPLVVQTRRSMGGEGTWIVRDAAALARLGQVRALRGGAEVLVRSWIPGRPCGVSVMVTPDQVALSAVRLQCFQPLAGARSLLFAGVQWLPTASLSRALAARVEAVMLRLGAALHARRFVGVANVDFIASGDDVLLLECNPRLSAATPQVLRHRELMTPDAGELLLSCYVSPPPRAERPALHGLPDSAFEGATMDLITPPAFRRSKVSGAPRSGCYTPDASERLRGDLRWAGGDDLCFVALAQPGEIVGPEETLGTVTCTRRLYDDSGEMLPVTSVISDNLMFNYSK